MDKAAWQGTLEGPLGTEINLWLTFSQKLGSSALKLKVDNFANSLGELGSGFFTVKPPDENTAQLTS